MNEVMTRARFRVASIAATKLALASTLSLAGAGACSGQIEDSGRGADRARVQGPGRASAGGAIGSGSPGAGGNAEPPAGVSGSGGSAPGLGTPGAMTSTGTAPNGIGPTGPAAPACVPGARVGTAPRIRMLTSVQYARTVATALAGVRSTDRTTGLTLPPSFRAPLAFVNAADRFSTRAASYTMRDADVQDAIAAADDIAGRMTAQLGPTSCVRTVAGFERCLEELVRKRGELLFRRPLDDDEAKRMTATGLSVLATVGPETAATQAFRALLMAPQFLFRAELGRPDPTNPGRAVLSPFELAAALSYDLTDGPPDQPLWNAAASGTLGTPTVLAAHAARLIGELPANEPLRRFLDEYLRFSGAAGLSKPAPPKPRQHRPEILVEETRLFVNDVLAVAGRRGFVASLLTSPTVFASRDTASVYGLSVAAATAQRISAGDPGRVGILGQPSWLISHSQADHNDPIRRGRFVREGLLCGTVPLANIDNLPQLPDDPKQTLREKLAAHTTNPTCQSCHRLMDPIGLGFEGFDHYGAPRATEAGRPVDASGLLAGSGDQDGPFVALRELAERLSRSQTVSSCFLAHTAQFFLGRELEAQDGCSLARSLAAYQASGGDLVGALQAIVTSDAYLVRIR